MSFTGKRNVWTYVLIALIPIAAVSGWLIASQTRNGSVAVILDISGSTTVFKIINTAKTNFTDSFPHATITVAGTGTGTGIRSLIDGTVDLAMASREVQSEENESADGHLRAFAIAKDGLTIIVHASADSLDITLDEARAIFNGTVSDWSDPIVAEANLSGPIQTVVREDGSGTRDAFNEIVMGDSKQLENGSSYINEITKNSNQLIVEGVAQNTNYIGYVGLGYVDATVDAAKINGVTPSLESVKDNSYEIQREMYLVTYDAPVGIVDDFINWVFSPTGQSIVVNTGFINVASTKEEI
ncbi:MAG: PstS family phosphate ABC transporter substrate-binding protein [Candidatus Heimdallarchaeota archaeon]